MRKNICHILTLAACIISCSAQAQTNKFVREGNKLYEQKKYKEAASDYQKALTKDPTYVPGLFNLGNTLYQQKQYDAARKVMNATAKTTTDKNSKAGVHYNIGNTYMQEQKWEDAVEAYKQALRNNPQDPDAKYNLSYAEEMLKKQNQDKKKNDDKNKDNKKDQQKKDQQDKDKKDKDKDKDKKDQQDKDQQDKNKDQDKDQQHPQSQPSKLSQQQADQLLNALQQEEKKLQDKMQKAKGVPVKTEKDW